MTTLFAPAGLTTRLDVDATTDSVALPGAVNPPTGATVRVFNNGSNECFVAFGSSIVTATLGADKATQTGIPLAAGRETGFRLTSAVTHIAAICNSGETTTIYVTMGDGI